MFNELQKRSRGEALAEAFFFRMDQELITSLGKSLSREEKIQSFEAVTGIRNPELMKCLYDAGFELSTLTAFIWAPVAFVAWADGNADHFEKVVICEALPKKGVPYEAVTMLMEHEWFANRPTEELWKRWEEFAAAWLANFSNDEREAVIDEIVAICNQVAHASGGILGFRKVSASEALVIERVTAALKSKSELEHIPDAVTIC